MAKTGPQKYPGASTAYWWQSKFGGSAMESNVGVMHTTEGRTVPDYGGGASAPNFTAMPDISNKRLRWFQHFDFDVSSRALVNKAGGVDTNTANAVQIELVGTCDERHATSWDGKRAGVDYIFWPDAPDWALAELGKFVKWAHDEHGIPLRSTVTWKPYNKGQAGGSYGANGVRLSGSQWNAYYGWLGHQHVPENDHGDPGNLDFARVLAHATGITTKPTAPAPSKEISVPDAPDMLDANNANDVDLPVAWTLLALPAEGGVILMGPGSYDAGVHLSLTGLPPGTRVQGRFHWNNGHDRIRSDRRPQYAYAAADGTVEFRYTDAGTLGLATDLRFEVRPDAPCTLIHRAVNGPHWTV
ncbi:hypothetical protein ACFWDI_36360 [Streptomyces sp. NPDC060064]|uniref:hypothetical protein n=1 Tax=Streptomyces sp. NPDC060064 TaxID=3347049 RepID=UPI0036B5D9AA